MKFLKSFWYLPIIFIGLEFSILAAPPNSPMPMLQETTQEVLKGLRTEKPAVKPKNDQWLYALVRRVVLPHVDVDGMSRSVLGRNVWLPANDKQKKDFIDAFTQVVINTYSSALNAYTNETIKFLPLRGNITGQTNLLVNSRVIREDGPPVALDYRVILMGNEWKIYDLVVEGVSLLQSFHAQFASELSKGKNLNQLIIDLQKRNRSHAT